MGLVVNTNTQSLFAQRALTGNSNLLQKSIEKLSTGFRINRAADDAAGLGISERLISQTRGFAQAERNIGDGTSLVQTAESALAIIQDNIQRVRELKVQSLNGTNGTKEIDAIQREVKDRIQTIADIVSGTKFNTLALIDGTFNKSLQTGANNAETTAVDFSDLNASVASTAAGSIGENAVLLNSINVGSSIVGAQVGTGATVANVSSAVGTLTQIDTILDNISRMRSKLGGIQNAIDSKAEYLNSAKENAAAANSRIKDVDVAEASSTFTKFQILQQSSAAMLSQANSSPQLALSLLPR